MSDFYLFISSKDSLQFHKDNCYHDFIVELGREYDVTPSQLFRSRSNWSVALVEIKLESDVGEPSPQIKDDLLVVCNVVSPSFIKGTERRILRPLPVGKSGQLLSLAQAYYMSLSTTCFSRLHITLLDKDLNKLKAEEGWPEEAEHTLSCTLHFQKM